MYRLTRAVTSSAMPASWRWRPASGQVLSTTEEDRYPVDTPEPCTLQVLSDCCQTCCQAAGQRPTGADKCGISAQHTVSDGRSWTKCPLLRIRRLGVRVPPSVPGQRTIGKVESASGRLVQHPGDRELRASVRGRTRNLRR